MADPSGPGVDVWLVDHDAGLNIATAAALADLSFDERRRAAAYATDQARRSFILSRWTLRAVLAVYFGIRPSDVILRIGAFGKPDVPGPPPYVNMSHAGSLGVVAVSRNAPVGVDLEHLRALPESCDLSRFVMTDRERAIFLQFDAKNRDHRFLELWTKKEALLKCKGTGLGKNPRDLCLAWNRSRIEIDGEPYFVSQVDIHRQSVCAVATKTRFGIPARILNLSIHNDGETRAPSVKPLGIEPTARVPSGPATTSAPRIPPTVGPDDPQR